MTTHDPAVMLIPIAVSAIGEGWDAATITVIGAVATAIITTASVAIVKVLAALQEMKLALIKAEQDRASAATKVAENTSKLSEIGKSTDGNLSAMSARLDLALMRIDEMQKAAASTASSSLTTATAKDPIKADLEKIEKNTAETADNTAKTDTNVQGLVDENKAKA